MNNEKSIIEEIENVCGSSFKRLNMPSYAIVENYYNYNEEGSIITLGLDLTKLSLDDNKIELLGEIIKKLKNLEKFLIKCPKDNRIPEWLKDLKNVKTLIFKNSYLTIVPEWLKEFKNLKILNLMDNKIQNLPEWFKEFKNLSYLNLANNKLIEVPEWLLDLPELKEIELNSITPSLELNDKNIRIIKSLMERNIKVNDILFKLHIELGVALDQINILKNIRNSNGENLLKIDTMYTINEPYNFSYYENIHIRILDGKIRQIGIQDYSLEELPENFGNLDSLISLNLSNNHLKSLPSSFGQLKDLKELNISKNSLSFLPESFSNLISIKKLDFSNNLFTEIPSELWNLPEFTELNLDNNPLTDEEKIISEKVPDIIRKHLRKKATIRVFISHAVIDFDSYRISQIVEYLENQKEISQVFFCEKDLSGNIDEWMLDTVQKCQLILFIATNKSVFNSLDCANELQLAEKFSIPIIPIKGYDVDWTDLAEKNLSRELGLEFDKKNFDSFLESLYKYIENFKREINLMERSKTLSSIIDIYERFRLILDEKFEEIHRKIDNFAAENKEKVVKLEEKIDDIEKKLQELKK